MNSKQMKNTNKILLVVLLVLLSAFVFTKVLRSPALESNLDTDAFQLDTAEIARIELRLPENDDPLTLERNDSAWTVRQGDKTARVRRAAMNNLFRTLAIMKPERVVSRKKEKWDSYQVGDTSAIRTLAYNRKGTEVGGWFVGKASQGMTYVRPSSQNEVYALEGSMRNLLNKSFNDWRDQSFLRMPRQSIDKITFRYPADSGFVLLKNDAGDWVIGTEKADSAKVENFLSLIQSKDLAGFADDFSPEKEPDIAMSVEGNSMSPVTVRGWKASPDEWILSSSLQHGVYFSDKTLATDLFLGKKDLLQRQQAGSQRF